MAQLIVRNLDEGTVGELKRRAARNGRSAEAEHREILQQVLRPRRPRRSLKALMLAMPDVGEDSDWNPPRQRGRRVRL